jgi:hypothetical protein
VLTGVAGRLCGEAHKGLGLAATLAPGRCAWRWGRLRSGTRAGPHPLEQEAQPHQGDQHQLREKESRDHGKTPYTGTEMRAFYLVFRRRELAARYRYTTGDRAQWRLGARPSTVLGFSTHADASRGDGESRSTEATGGVAHWEWRDHTRYRQSL